MKLRRSLPGGGWKILKLFLIYYLLIFTANEFNIICCWVFDTDAEAEDLEIANKINFKVKKLLDGLDRGLAGQRSRHEMIAGRACTRLRGGTGVILSNGKILFLFSKFPFFTSIPFHSGKNKLKAAYSNLLISKI